MIVHAERKKKRMKIRLAFVSNSSSESFTCDFCGHTASGWDMGLNDAQLYECVNGHTFCDEHAIEMPDISLEDMIKEIIKHDDIYRVCGGDDVFNIDDIKEIYRQVVSEQRYEFPSKHCPFCQFEKITDHDYVSYVSKKWHLLRRLVLKEMKNDFENFEQFKTFVGRDGDGS